MTMLLKLYFQLQEEELPRHNMTGIWYSHPYIESGSYEHCERVIWKRMGQLGYLKHDRLNEYGTFERECHYESLNIH